MYVSTPIEVKTDVAEVTDDLIPRGWRALVGEGLHLQEELRLERRGLAWR